MAYLKIYQNYLPYALMKDKRGFISMRFGTNGHTGIDSVGNQASNPVCAVMSGKVFSTRNDTKLGNVVEYGEGNIRIAYYHLASITVCAGDAVVAGQTKIGVEGSTGTLAKGKHLHVSIWIDGNLVDPEPYLNGQQELKPMKNNLGDDFMFRKITKVGLNMRSSVSTANSSNIVYANMPVGTYLVVNSERQTVGAATWGKVFTTINGKTYAGWCNLSTAWSEEV